MARISGINIPLNKHVYIGLQSVHGIGMFRAVEICEKAKVDKNSKVSDLSEDDVNKIRVAISDLGYTLEGDLRRERSMNIKRLMTIGSYRGIRHHKGLPVRGQNTKTNARTRKGPRKS